MSSPGRADCEDEDEHGQRQVDCPMRWLAAVPLRGKFGQDVLWNLVSYGILAVSGVVLNVVIGRFYGEAILGVFTQVFALHLLFSQFAVFGIHYSVTKHIAEFADDRPKCDVIVTSALALTAACAGGVLLAGYALSGAIGRVFASPGIETGWRCALPGLWCFAVNKVLLGVLNGERSMRAFAVGLAVRYVLAVLLLGVCLVARVPGVALPATISVSEFVLLLFLLVCVFRSHRLVGIRQWSGWARQHLHFGARGFLSGALDGINTQVSVLLLGYFSTDREVGIYSMASLFVVGFVELSVVVRKNVNPIVTRFVALNELARLREMVGRGVRAFYAVMALVGVVAILLYPVAIDLLVRNRSFLASWPPFAILMVGLMLSAGYLPFNMILVQAGYPGTHTLLNAAVALTTVVLNALLVPSLHVAGAAYATGASFILAAIYLKLLVYGRLGLRI